MSVLSAGRAVHLPRQHVVFHCLFSAGLALSCLAASPASSSPPSCSSSSSSSLSSSSSSTPLQSTPLQSTLPHYSFSPKCRFCELCVKRSTLAYYGLLHSNRVYSSLLRAIRIAQKASSMVKICDELRPKGLFWLANLLVRTMSIDSQGIGHIIHFNIIHFSPRRITKKVNKINPADVDSISGASINLPHGQPPQVRTLHIFFETPTLESLQTPYSIGHLDLNSNRTFRHF